jgi:hypothetical protein
LGQGREKVRALLKDERALFDKIDQRVREIAFAPDAKLPASLSAAVPVAEG